MRKRAERHRGEKTKRPETVSRNPKTRFSSRRRRRPKGDAKSVSFAGVETSSLFFDIYTQGSKNNFKRELGRSPFRF
jgi:hypothetical protein